MIYLELFLNSHDIASVQVRSVLDASKDLVRGLGETLGKKYPSGTHPVLQCFGKVVLVIFYHFHHQSTICRWLKNVKP